MTPTIMSPIARASSAVSTIFGNSSTTSRSRHRRVPAGAIDVIPGAERSEATRNPCTPARVHGFRARGYTAPPNDSIGDADPGSHLGRDDFFPHPGELRLS